MIAQVIRLLAAASLGMSAKKAVARGVRHAALIALGCVLLFAGAVFGLVAAYWGLRSHFPPVEAAGLIAALLVLGGLALLALRAVLSSRAGGGGAGPGSMTAEHAASAVQRGAEDVTRTLGPVNVIALALVLGIAAGRGMSRS